MYNTIWFRIIIAGEWQRVLRPSRSWLLPGRQRGAEHESDSQPWHWVPAWDLAHVRYDKALVPRRFYAKGFF